MPKVAQRACGWCKRVNADRKPPESRVTKDVLYNSGSNRTDPTSPFATRLRISIMKDLRSECNLADIHVRFVLSRCLPGSKSSHGHRGRPVPSAAASNFSSASSAHHSHSHCTQPYELPSMRANSTDHNLFRTKDRCQCWVGQDILPPSDVTVEALLELSIPGG